MCGHGCLVLSSFVGGKHGVHGACSRKGKVLARAVPLRLAPVGAAATVVRVGGGLRRPAGGRAGGLN